MTFAHFYDLNGNPITGKSPIQIRVTGGKMTAVVQAGVQSFLNSFLSKARISIAEKNEQAVLLPDGTYVEASSSYGTVKVKVEIPAKPVEQDNPSPDFFGGIVIQLRYYPDETVFFGPGLPDESAASTLVPEVASRGAIIGKPGRPAVPGVGKTETTDWLLLQVARNKPLGVDPIGTGAVKIFRITDPKVGPYCEVNSTPGTYLLSANNTLSEFYICGKLAEFLPPLPLTDEDRETLGAMDIGAETETGVRIRTYKFTPPSFVRAGKTHGYVFVAVAKKLFGINTRDRPLAGVATWQLLHTAFFDSLPQYINDFGTTFTTTRTPAGATTITCSGSNGAGVCSGFAVTITPGTGGAKPTLTGVLNLMHDGSVAEVGRTLTATYSLSVNGSVVVGTEPAGVPASFRGSNIAYTVQRELSGGNRELRTNRLTGGRGALELNSTLVDEMTQTRATSFHSWWSPLFLIDGLVVQERGSPVFNTEVSATYTSSETGGRSGNPSSEIQYTLNVLGLPGLPSMGGGVLNPFTSSVSSSYSEAATADTALTDGGGTTYDSERHIGAVFFRISTSRTGTRSTLTPHTGEPHLDGLANPEEDALVDPLPYVLKSVTHTYSAMTRSEALVRRGGTVLHEWSNEFARFSITPPMAGPQSFTGVGAYYKYWGPIFKEVTGPKYSYQGESVHSYSSWFPAIVMSRYAATVGYPPTPLGPPQEKVGFPLFPFGTTPSDVPGVYGFSFSYDYDQDQPTGYTVGDFIAIQPHSMYGYLSRDPDSLDLPNDPLPVAVTVSHGTSLVEGNGVASLLLAGEHGTTPWLREDREIFYDLRTGGFVAESLIKAEISPGVWESSLETFIGNDQGIVPLRPIIDAWRALGQLDGATNDRRILISGRKRVSLI